MAIVVIADMLIGTIPIQVDGFTVMEAMADIIIPVTEMDAIGEKVKAVLWQKRFDE